MIRGNTNIASVNPLNTCDTLCTENGCPKPSYFSYLFVFFSHFLGFPHPILPIEAPSMQKKCVVMNKGAATPQKASFMYFLFFSILHATGTAISLHKVCPSHLGTQNIIEKKEPFLLSLDEKKQIHPPIPKNVSTVQKTLLTKESGANENQRTSLQISIPAKNLLGEEKGNIAKLTDPFLAKSQKSLIPEPKTLLPNDPIILRYPFAIPERNSIEVQTEETSGTPLLMEKKLSASIIKNMEQDKALKKRTSETDENPFFVHPPKPTRRQNAYPSRVRPPSPDILDQTTDFFKNVVDEVGGFIDKIFPFSEANIPKSQQNPPNEQHRS